MCGASCLFTSKINIVSWASPPPQDSQTPVDAGMKLLKSHWANFKNAHAPPSTNDPHSASKTHHNHVDPPDRSRHRPQLTPQMDDGHQTNCILFPTTIAMNGCADSISATSVLTSAATSITNTKFHDFSVSQPHNFRHECNMALISTKPLGVTSL